MNVHFMPVIAKTPACFQGWAWLLASLMKIPIRCAAVLVLLVLLPGCLTQRTVSEGGHTVSQEYVIKRPLKEAIENSQ